MNLPVNKFFKLLEKNPDEIYSAEICYKSGICVIFRSNNRNINLRDNIPENFAVTVSHHNYHFNVSLTPSQKERVKDIVTKYITTKRKEAYNELIKKIDNE